ncbi:phosphate-starvation-inducible protein PsiE [Paenibacillus lycopersici]|uniref:Protein PsiE n=1 Tax=Paenibacillus lycopersici TaxID=2704462 RepID=A0A6C0G1E4_9BACL|nr:phosphate-starvation-inducible protein PsiE [Paenibacillus lycopersici]QHT61194.1 phosphate-starvation-inducible protein PsiE [Paenibacillus lycopersici]
MFGLLELKGKTWIVRAFQLLLNASLVILALILCYYLVCELCTIIKEVFLGNNNVHSVLENVLAFFLYFVFISMIVKYFCENDHFPLRYLLYIGITGSIRFIIVNHDNTSDNLYLSLSILVLVISYVLLAPGLLRAGKEGEAND